jgi:hypothetical protein
MANAKRRRTQTTTDDDFGIDLAVGIAQLLPARHIAPGDSWYLRIEGDQLVITRSRPIVSIPDPDS